MGGALTEEGLDTPVTAFVQHDDLDNLLALDERVGPLVGVRGHRAGAWCLAQLPPLVKKGGALWGWHCTELVRLKPVVN